MPLWSEPSSSGGPVASGYGHAPIIVTYAPTRSSNTAQPTETPVKHTVLFAGQSNALGFGNNGAAPYAANDRVQILADTTGDGIGDAFTVMRPGTNTGTPANPRAWGPEVEFANQWLAAHPTGTLHIGKVAKGSTPLAAAEGLDWSPQSTGELYDQAKEASSRMRAALGVASLDAVFWMQGEQDATIEAWAGAYATNLDAFLTAVRVEWMRTSRGYVAAGQISDSGVLAYDDAVRAAQSQVDEADPQFETFPTSGFAMQGDGLHYAAEGQVALGRAFYEAWTR